MPTLCRMMRFYEVIYIKKETFHAHITHIRLSNVALAND